MARLKWYLDPLKNHGQSWTLSDKTLSAHELPPNLVETYIL